MSKLSIVRVAVFAPLPALSGQLWGRQHGQEVPAEVGVRKGQACDGATEI